MTYWMKYIFSLVFRIVLFGAVLSSCTNEVELPVETVAEGTPVNIGFDLRSVGGEEGRINSVRVILVRDNIAGEIIRNIFISDLNENPLTLELMSGNYRVYVVANEDMYYRGSRVADLDGVRNYAELKEVTLKYSWGMYTNPENLPMFGQVTNVKIMPASTNPQSETNRGTVSVNGRTPENILEVSLERLVCKIKLLIKTENYLDLRSDFDIGCLLYNRIPLFEDYDGDLGYRNYTMLDEYLSYDWGDDWSSGYTYLPTYSFFPRNDESIAPQLEIKRKNEPWSGRGKPIGHNINPSFGNLDYTLHRNCIYSLSVNFNYQFGEISVNSWHGQWVDDDGVDAPLFDGSQLDVPNVVVMDQGQSPSGPRFSRKVGYTSNYYEPVEISVGGQVITGTETNLPGCPAWLTEARLTRDREDSSEGEFTFTYVETEGDDHPDYVITLQSGNITKQLRVRYKNGTP